MGVRGRKKTSMPKELGDPIIAGEAKLQEKTRRNGVRVLPIMPPEEQVIKPTAVSVNQSPERKLDEKAEQLAQNDRLDSPPPLSSGRDK